LTHEVTFDLSGTDANPVVLEEADVLYWVLCHVLIDALPKSSLAEAAENIADVYRDYLVKAKVATMVAPKIQGALVGRFGAQRDRVPMTFSDEV
jgi:hypothetical protein